MRLIDRYLFRELLSPFLLGISLLTFLMVIYQLLRLTEWVMDKGVGVLIVADLFVKQLPSFFLLTIPMAAAFAAILALNRLSFDNELMTLNASGIPFLRILRPLCLFAFFASGLTLVMGTLSQQYGAASFKSTAIKLLKEKVGVGIDAGQFTEILPGLMIYTESMPSSSEMNRVFIYDGRPTQQAQIIVAQKGILINNDPQNETSDRFFGLRLFDGLLHTHHQERDRLILFGSYSLKIRPPVPDEPANNTYAPPATLTPRRQLAFYKKYAFSFASFLFCFMGVPFGLLSGKTGRLSAFVGGLGLILFYYALTMIGDYLMSAKTISSLIAAWFPNLVLLPITLALLIPCIHEANMSVKWSLLSSRGEE
jgi:lipopolysaccharide export system permease protein